MKNFISFLLFASFSYAQIIKEDVFSQCDHPNRFNSKQKEILLDAYIFGEKQGFGYILSAIAWQESCAGEYLVNFADPSAGIFHAHIPLVIKQYTKLQDNSFNRNIIGQLLLKDHDFALKVALDQLLFWEKKYQGNQEKIIKSYNKGTSWIKNENSNLLAQRYYQEIQDKIQKLQEFIPQKLLEKKQPKKPPFVDTMQKKQETKFYFLPEP